MGGFLNLPFCESTASIENSNQICGSGMPSWPDGFFYQRDGEIIAFVRSDLAVAGTGLSSAAPVVDIQVMNAA